MHEPVSQPSQQHKTPSPRQRQSQYQRIGMADTDKAIKLEDESADSTIQIKVEADGLEADLDRQWDWSLDESQPLDSKQTQSDEKYCPIACVELEYEPGTLHFSSKPLWKYLDNK